MTKAMKFEDGMIIHCPERQQAWHLISETNVPIGRSKEEAISGWDRYKERTVYEIMLRPSWEKPTLVVFGSIDDEDIVGKKIVKYTDIR